MGMKLRPEEWNTLDRGFVLEDKRPEREYFIVTCKTCGKRWSLAANSRHGGNILALLNHEASHKS